MDTILHKVCEGNNIAQTINGSDAVAPNVHGLMGIGRDASNSPGGSCVSETFKICNLFCSRHTNLQ